jgi:S-formylglutathione hydrolase FrmB
MKTLINQVRTLTVVGVVLGLASIAGVANAQQSLISQAIAPASTASSQSGSPSLEAAFGTSSQPAGQYESPTLNTLGNSLNQMEVGNAYAIAKPAPKPVAEVETKTASAVPGFDILSIFAGTMTVGMLFVRQRKR